MEGSFTIPLYDRVKNQIYDEFQRLKRQQTIVLTIRSNRKKVMSLKLFQSKFLRFFYELHSLHGFEAKLDEYTKDKLIDFAIKINSINSIKKVNEVTMLSSGAIRQLDITKISMERNNDSFV